MILDGVRVVELTAWVAGPAAAGVLADWGADVVKVEPASGDPQRSIFGAVGVRDQASVPPFELDNRGKRSVVLDLRADAGREAMERLLAGADVFVTNMRVAALAAPRPRPDRGPRAPPVAGLRDHHRLRPRRPRRPPARLRRRRVLGPLDARRVGRAPRAAAAGDPRRPRRPRHRHDAGRRHLRRAVRPRADRQRPPRVDEPAAHRAVLRRLGPRGAAALRQAAGHTRPREAHAAAAASTATPPPTTTGFWLLGLEADRHWPGLVAAIERPDLAADERFADARARAVNARR